MLQPVHSSHQTCQHARRTATQTSIPGRPSGILQRMRGMMSQEGMRQGVTPAPW